jgi:hypothetical protein
MWAAAKDYWLPPDPSDLAAAAAAVAGDAAGDDEDDDSGAPGLGGRPAGGPSVINGLALPNAAAGPQQQQQQQQGQAPLAALVARVRAGGVRLTRGQVEAARKLLELREAAARRREAFVSALWGLSAIGGSWLFQEEVEALLQVGGGWMGMRMRIDATETGTGTRGWAGLGAPL